MNKKLKKIHVFFIILSIAVNIILGVFSIFSSLVASNLENKVKSLEIENIEREQELLIEKNTAQLLTFYLISKIENLRFFIKSGETFPFVQQVEDYRIIENREFLKLESEFNKAINKNSSSGIVHFLVVANPGDRIAHESYLITYSGNTISLGNIESHTAVLVPTYYRKSINSETRVKAKFTSIHYSSIVGDLQKQLTDSVKAPVKTSWMPILGDLRGWGRASVKKDDSYLKDLLE